MPRTKPTSDETITVRLPAGTADKLRAATGQKFSTLVRAMCLGLLDQYSTPPTTEPIDGK